MTEKQIWNKVHFMPVFSLACNANCNYCFGPNRGKTITTEMLNHVTDFIKRIINETNQSKVGITFHGGEPLLADITIWERALKNISEILPGKKSNFSLQSNLWDLNDEFCKLFQKYNVSVGSSLDGPEALNDAQRGKGYFKKTMQGISVAENYNLKPGCICTFTSKTVNKYEEIFRFFIQNRLSFSTHATLPTINGENREFALSAEEYGQLLCDLLDLYIKYRHYIKISSLDQLITSVTEQEGQVCSFKECLGMFMAIDPNGEIYPCQRLAGNQKYSMGNILSSPTLGEINNSEVARQFIQRQLAVKQACSKCEHYAYCKGGCTYNAWAVGEDIDPYCKAYKMIFKKIKDRLLHELEAEENIKAIAEKPLNRYQKNPLLREGPLIELSRKNAHPVRITTNAINIICYVSIASNNSLERTHKMLSQAGLSVTIKYLKDLKSKMKKPVASFNNLYIHSTFKCQLNCKHCYALADKNMHEYMSVEDIIRIINEAEKSSFQKVVITGGEPLLNPDLDNLLKNLILTKNQLPSIYLDLRTNFVKNLSESELKRLAKAFTKIVVSIDGTSEYHNKRRGKGTYEATINNLKKYQDLFINDSKVAELSLCSVMSSEDMQGALGQSVYNLANQLNIKHVRFRPILPIGRANKPEIPIVSESINSFYDLEELLIQGRSLINTCGIGQNLYIEPNGNAFPCYAYQKPHSYLGNVIDSGLNHVLNSDKFLDLRRHTVDTNPKCKECKYKYLCGGACRAWGGEKTSFNLDAPPPECEGLYKRAEEIYLYALNYLESNHLVKKNSIVL